MKSERHTPKGTSQNRDLIRLCIMLGFTGSFFFVEFIIGYMTGALSLVSDSFHMLSDVVAMVVAFIAIKISLKKWSKNTYGWARAEVLGSLINAVFLCALCFSVFVEALMRYIDPKDIEMPWLVLGIGITGLIVNIIGLCLFRHGYSHSGHGQEDEKGSSMNIKGVFLHVAADALGSVIVTGSALLYIVFKGEHWTKYVDPTLSLMSVCLILFSTWGLLMKSSLILLQTTPAHIDIKELKRRLKDEIPQIIEVHDLHVWQLTGEKHIATAHILCQDADEYMLVAEKIKTFFHKLKIHSTTIQPEFIKSKESVRTDCQVKCPPPAPCYTCCTDAK